MILRFVPHTNYSLNGRRLTQMLRADHETVCISFAGSATIIQRSYVILQAAYFFSPFMAPQTWHFIFHWAHQINVQNILYFYGMWDSKNDIHADIDLVVRTRWSLGIWVFTSYFSREPSSHNATTFDCAEGNRRELSRWKGLNQPFNLNRTSFFSLNSLKSLCPLPPFVVEREAQKKKLKWARENDHFRSILFIVQRSSQFRERYFLKWGRKNDSEKLCFELGLEMKFDFWNWNFRGALKQAGDEIGIVFSGSRCSELYFWEKTQQKSNYPPVVCLKLTSFLKMALKNLSVGRSQQMCLKV